MPRFRRYHPVSHDFNRDPEIVQLRKDFGDWAALAWIEMLSIADRNDGKVPGTVDQIAEILAPISLQKYHQRATNAARTMLERFTDNSWTRLGYLTDAAKIAGHFNCIEIVNYAEYHRTRVTKQAPSEPNLTIPNLTKIEEKNKKPQAATFLLPDWMPADSWEEFAQHRKRKRAPLTDKIAARIIAVIDRLRTAGHDPADVIAQACNRNWTSIEFDWVHKVSQVSAENKPSAIELIRQRTAEMLRRGL